MSGEFKKLITNPLLNIMNVKRFSNMPFIHNDTDCTHSFRMQLMCVILFQDNPLVNLEKLTHKALLHDINEAGAGDVISPIKHCSPEVNAAIEAKSNDILRSWGVNEHTLNSIINAKDDSIEGKIVSILDILDAYYSLYVEWRLQELKMLYDRADDCISYANLKMSRVFDDAYMNQHPEYTGIRDQLKALIDSAGDLLPADFEE